MELLKNIDENDEDAFNDIINNWWFFIKSSL
jgi:hypothetical protein